MLKSFLKIITNRKTWVGINSGPGDQGTRGPTGILGSLYTSQLVLGTSASSLAANPLFSHHDASHDVYQLEL